MDDQNRLKTIDDFLLSNEVPLDLDDLMVVLAGAYKVPIALIGIVGEFEETFKARYGTTLSKVSREHAFCSHVVEERKQVVVNNTHEDPRFKDNPLVTGEPHICFYAGTPIEINDEIIGAVCLIDTVPREIDAQYLEVLNRIGALVSQHISLSKEHEALKREHGLIEKSPIVLATWRNTTSLRLVHISQNSERVLGISAQDLLCGAVELGDVLTQDAESDFTFAMQAHMEGVETHSCRLQIATPTRTIWVSMISTASFREDGMLYSVQAFLFDTSDQKYVEDKLHKTNQRMRLLLEASELGTWDWNLAADVNQVNKRWCDIVGLEYEYYDTSSRFFRQLIHPADYVKVEKQLNEHIIGESKVFNTTFRMKHTNGTWVWVETYGKTVESDVTGKAIRVAGIHRDITQRMESELHEKKKTQLLQFINKTRASYLQNNDLTMACQTVLPELIDISDSQFAFIGQMKGEGDASKLFIHAISEIVWDSSSFTQYNEYKKRNLYFASFDNLFGTTILTGEVTISNTSGSHPNSKGVPQGHPRISRFLGLPIKVKDRVVGMIGLANKFEPYALDDAEFLQPLLDALAGLFYAVELEEARAIAEEKLRKLAMTDSLTGLYNRRAFVDKCHQLSAQSNRVSVAVIDIDHFKKVNDTYGHDAGDQALISVAHLIEEYYVEPDIVSRLGGEEFAIVAISDNKKDEEMRFNKLREAVEKTEVRYKKDTISVTISIGAVFAEDSLNLDFSGLLSKADKLLYTAKKNGRNQVILE
ncbi:sensor domain-containing diguanylate cyclase [Alteromonas sp. PRIM-21]|uniref:sensor domain-containing diguanylate cyclase n=1 Tax=Alteromonas sp. PRIM-21 TaxID=1454978 RepID=UPI0022B99411|nr:diguanylate cyclase [Alteromonas sp. PRIM-21]MCZ8530293.1 diguanylate cyclase [Alteromonas sp. PRIM-21]